MILNHEQVMDFLIQEKEGKIKFLSGLEIFNEFVKQFNEEAKKQNCIWFAEIDEWEEGGEKKYSLYVSREKAEGWWIFKTRTRIQLHTMYSGYYHFVSNDYSFNDYSTEKNEKILSLLPEFKSVLENMTLPFVILYDYSSKNFEKELSDVSKRIEKLEEEA